MVGAAVIPQGRRVYGVRDSKMLPEDRREALFDRVAGWCSTWAVGAATSWSATPWAWPKHNGWRRGVPWRAWGRCPTWCFSTGNWDFVGTGNTVRIVRGDARCLSIAAASMLAKVTRDRHMRAVAPNYPHYEFQDNKGYPCWRHKMALQAYGPCTIHRRTWVFMEGLSWDMRSHREGAGDDELAGAQEMGQEE